MRNMQNALLSGCSGEQLFLLAVANAGLRPAVSRVLDQRARSRASKPAVLARIPHAPAQQASAMLRCAS